MRINNEVIEALPRHYFINLINFIFCYHIGPKNLPQLRQANLQ